MGTVSSSAQRATATQLGNWSDSATWGKSHPSCNEEDVTIPMGATADGSQVRNGRLREFQSHSSPRAKASNYSLLLTRCVSPASNWAKPMATSRFNHSFSASCVGDKRSASRKRECHRRQFNLMVTFLVVDFGRKTSESRLVHFRIIPVTYFSDQKNQTNKS